jgi:hypothetical protein
MSYDAIAILVFFIGLAYWVGYMTGYLMRGLEP